MRSTILEREEVLDPPTLIEVTQALEWARQLVSQGPGLAKGSGIADVGGWPCYCIVAAITHASRTKQIRDAAMQATRLALPGRWFQCSIEAFNDAKTTDVEDAKTLLQRAKSNVAKVLPA